MIIDCFLFFNEIDLLKLRLETLWNHVDYFLLVEGNKTHQNKEKKSYYDLYADEFKKYESKLIRYNITEWPEYQEGVQFAIHQRNQIKSALTNTFELNDEDIILISDADEIIDIQYLNFLQKIQSVFAIHFKTRLFYYYFNLECCDYAVTDSIEFSIRAIQWKNLKHIQINDLRLNSNGIVIPKAGWHFSYLGNVQHIITKLQSFGHEQFNNEFYTDPKYVEHKITQGLDLFGRNIHFNKIILDNNFPFYILEHKSELKNLIL